MSSNKRKIYKEKHLREGHDSRTYLYAHTRRSARLGVM
jgi:hypothetical protein